MRKLYLLAVFLSLGASAQAYAHAIVGDRVFPATLGIDDPGVSDELNLPQVSRSYQAGTWTTDVSGEFDKRITDNFALSVGGDWLNQGGTTGFDNVELGGKYVFLKNAEHEIMLSSELTWEIGGTGAKRIADNFSTLTPSLLFGKGMGDLPDSMDYLKPFALTGMFGIAVPTDRYSTDDSGITFNPNIAQWGFTLQYSLPYLQQHVKDIGLGKPFSEAVPVVEFVASTPTGGDTHMTTGTFNPGIIFMGTEMQVGVEALVPMNRASGDRVGFVTQLHFYLDDIFPKTIGKPLLEQ